MLKKLQIVIVLFILISCQSEEEKLIGHWHEYKSDQIDYLNCYKITDSTFGINSFTTGYLSSYKRGSQISPLEIVSIANDSYNWTSDFTIQNDKLYLNDSIFWVKQSNEQKDFLNDFSGGLLLKLHPFESDENKFDYVANKQFIDAYIYIGKIKKSISNKDQTFNENEYYIQLNDRIGKLNEIKNFVDCGHCDQRRQRIFIHADKNTPHDLLDKIESEIIQFGGDKNNIYYLTINLEKMTMGYNHSY